MAVEWLEGNKDGVTAVRTAAVLFSVRYVGQTSRQIYIVT